MRELPIQYSAPMVLAERAGTKTVTRRTVKGEIPAGAVRAVFQQRLVNRPPAWHWLDAMGATLGKPFRCPYGVAGDRLWVREAWRTTGDGGRADSIPPRDLQPSPVWYVADGRPPADECAGKVRPGMFMPRWASRDLLEVTGVACERLQDITSEQAIAEGIEQVGKRWRHYFFPHDDSEAWEFPVNSFASLWASLNGEESWEANPFVFAISFRRITP